MSSIRKMRNGKWQAQYRPVPGGKQITRTSSLRGEVEAWLEAQIAAKVTGTAVHPGSHRLTLREFYDSWSSRQVWESTTRRSMDLAMRQCPFADRPIARIEVEHIEAWVKEMTVRDRGENADGIRVRGLAPLTIKTRFECVRKVLRAAVASRKIPSDPSTQVRLPRVRRASAAMTIPTGEDVRRILETADPQWRALIAVCAFAGLRLGEASALRVSDIDWLRRTVSVRRQVAKGQGGLEVRAPKFGSERTVFAADGLLQILSAHVATLHAPHAAGEWLFPSESGGPAAPSTVHYAWQRARDRATSEPFHLHDLRHYFASGLIHAGCDVATVQHALGHSSPSVTLNTYTHLWPAAEDRTRAAAQTMISAALGATDEFLTKIRLTSA